MQELCENLLRVRCMMMCINVFLSGVARESGRVELAFRKCADVL